MQFLIVLSLYFKITACLAVKLKTDWLFQKKPVIN